MRRYVAAPWLAAPMALATGVLCFLWEVHDLGQSCGYREGDRQPNFPTKIALVILVGVPVVLTVGRAISERRSAAGVMGLAVLAAILAGVAFGAADFAFSLSRHCYA
jgi:hypothetical protein